MTHSKRTLVLTILALLSCIALVCLALGIAPSDRDTVLAEEVTVDHGTHEGYTALTSAGGELTSGNYYLTENVNLLTDLTIPSGATVTLCLNGYKLTGTGTNSVITVQGNFTLCDCNSSNSTHKYNVDESGKYVFTEDGTAGEITGGVITGGISNGNYGGGGICVRLDGAFTMEGGTIAGNTAKYGAGLNLYDEVTMNGGAIRGNVTSENGEGGGVLVNSHFTMNGGIISDNVANGKSDGVYVAMTVQFTMNGGTVNGNKINESSASIYVPMWQSIVQITGGYIGNAVIRGPQAYEPIIQGGYYAQGVEGTSETGGTVFELPVSTGYKVTFMEGFEYPYAVSPEEVTPTIHTGHEDIQETKWYLVPATGGEFISGNYVLQEDVKLTTDITIPKGVMVTLCLNGHKLTGTGTSSVIKVEGTLILCDCNGSNGTHAYSVDSTGKYLFGSGDKTINGGVITGGTGFVDGADVIYGGGIYVPVGGNLTIEGGTIAGNTATYGAGVSAYGTLTMNGGAVSGNVTSKTGEGGGVVAAGTFTMNGGTISENVANNKGGGVHVTGGGSFVMNDGTITGNKVTTGAAGVYAANTTTINGGTISSNTAGNRGGALYVESGKTLTIKNATIKDNTASQGGAVYVNAGTLNIVGSTLSGNNATDNGGAVYASNGTVTMSGGAVTGNTSSQATGFRVQGTTTLTIDAGTLTDTIINQGTVNINAGYFSGTINNEPAGKVNIKGGYYTEGTEGNSGTGKVFGLDVASGFRVVATQDTEYGFSVCSEKVNIVSHEGHEDIVGDWFELLDGFELLSGNYVLNNDIDLTTDITIPSGVTVTLCLNGHKLTGTGTSSVIKVEGNLTLCDCNGSNGTHKYNVDENGKYVFTPDGTAGEITGGVITGGIGTDEYGTKYGGAIYAGYESKITIDGGTIAGNEADLSDDWSSGGGIRSNGSVEMNGGAIRGNVANFYGGGIDVDTFVMNGGTISENAIIGKNESAGGGLSVNSGEMNGGTISNNSSSGNGGGIQQSASDIDSIFAINDGTITGNKANSGGAIYIYGGKTVLNNVVISGNSATYDGGAIYIVSPYYAQFEMYGGEIKGNTATGKGGAVCSSNFPVIISGGTIADNKANKGGAIVVENMSSVTIKGTALISGNSADTDGGAIYVDVASTMSIEGGEITGNTATGNGGAAVVTGKSGNGYKSAATISGGLISGNTAGGQASGIVVGSENTLSVSGGTVVDTIVNTGTTTVEGGNWSSPIENTGTVTIKGGYYAFGEANSAETVLGMSIAAEHHVARLVEGDEGYNADYPYTVKSGAAPDTTLTPTVGAIDYDTQSLSMEDFGFANQADIKEFSTTYTVQGAEPGEAVEGLPTNQGTYTINVVYLIYGRDSTTSFQFTINPKTVVVEWGALELVYNGSAQVPTVTAGEAELNVTVEVGSAINVGTYNVSISLVDTLGNYILEGETTKQFTIVAKEVVIEWGALELVYNGSAQVPTVTAGGQQLQFTVEQGEAINVGTYNVSISLVDTSGNYKLVGETSKQFTISKATNSLVGNALDQWIANGDFTTAPELEAQFGTVVVTYKLADGTVVDTLPTDAGTYTIVVTVEGTSNYNQLTIEKQFEIPANSSLGWGIAIISVLGVVLITEIVLIVLKMKKYKVK